MRETKNHVSAGKGDVTPRLTCAAIPATHGRAGLADERRAGTHIRRGVVEGTSAMLPSPLLLSFGRRRRGHATAAAFQTADNRESRGHYLFTRRDYYSRSSVVVPQIERSNRSGSPTSRNRLIKK